MQCKNRHSSFCGLRIATLITRFQHISGYRKQSRRKESISFVDPFTSLRNYGGYTQNLLLAVIPLDVRVNKGNVIWILWQKLAESLARGAATPTGEKRQYSSRARPLNQYRFRTLFLKRICAKSYQLHTVLTLISLTCQCKQKHEINQWLLNIIVVLQHSNNLLQELAMSEWTLWLCFIFKKFPSFIFFFQKIILQFISTLN